MMSNSVVVVTGGSGGIGQALVKKYLQEGCFVISADLEKTTDFDDKNFSFLQCNVECENSINNLFEFVLRKYNRIDYFFQMQDYYHLEMKILVILIGKKIGNYI